MNTPKPILSSQSYVGIQHGYIIIPGGVDRDTFVEQCYRWERVSILIERGGGCIHDCYITQSTLKDIVFPATKEQFGSCVSFITDPLNGHPVIYGIVSKEDESLLLREYFFKTSKTYNGGTVSVTGDAKTGVLNVSVNGGTLSQLNILVSNTNKDASINVQCRGAVNLTLDDVLNIITGKDINIKTDKNTIITTSSFKINSGSEAMVKGDELKTQLDKTNTLLQAIINLLVGASIPEPGNNAPSALQAALKTVIGTNTLGDYTNIKSEESFLD